MTYIIYFLDLFVFYLSFDKTSCICFLLGISSAFKEDIFYVKHWLLIIKLYRYWERAILLNIHSERIAVTLSIRSKTFQFVSVVTRGLGQYSKLKGNFFGGPLGQNDTCVKTAWMSLKLSVIFLFFCGILFHNNKNKSSTFEINPLKLCSNPFLLVWHLFPRWQMGLAKYP